MHSQMCPKLFFLWLLYVKYFEDKARKKEPVEKAGSMLRFLTDFLQLNVNTLITILQLCSWCPYMFATRKYEFANTFTKTSVLYNTPTLLCLSVDIETLKDFASLLLPY